MAIDLKQGIDLKQIGSQIKAIFAKDSNALQNKSLITSVVSILVSFLLIYLIIDISDNQTVFTEAKGRYDNTTLQLSKIENRLNKALTNNKVYFKQLKNSAKTQSELSANITSLVSKYSLLLKSIDLNSDVAKQKGKGIKLVVSGSYLNLIRFSSAMNKVLSASQLMNLAVKKSKKTSTLIMSLSVVFSAPPPSNSLPTQAVERADNLNLVLRDPSKKLEKSLANDLLSLFISTVNASESELDEILPVEQALALPPLVAVEKNNGLSLFKKAYSSARAQGLIKFEFTNKVGETKQYLTGLKSTQNSLPIENEVKQVQLAKILPIEKTSPLPPLEANSVANIPVKPLAIQAQVKQVQLREILPVEQALALPPLVAVEKNNGLSLFKKAYSSARAQGLIKFEFTNKVGETKQYLTGLKSTQNSLPIENEVKQVQLAKILPIEKTSPLPTMEDSLSESRQNKAIKIKKAKSLNNFQKAYVGALLEGQSIFEFKSKDGKTRFYKTDQEGYELAGFVEKPTKNNQEVETQDSAPTENLRDPFATPGTSRAPKINRGGQASGSEEPYYLSGVLTSEADELCVVITPIGESKIYHTGDKITDKISITGIFSDAIMTNLSNTKILIGDEIR